MNRLFANTSALAVSNLWRILVSFLLQLLIGRQLGVEALGLYAIALAYLNLAQIISEVGLPGLFVRDLAQRATQRRSYFRQALWLQIGVALLAWGGLVLLATASGFSATTRSALLLIGASLPFYAVTSATQTLFQAGERMELVFAVELVINALILLLSGFLLWQGTSVLPLIGVLVVTQLLSAIFGWWLLRRSGIITGAQRDDSPAPVALLRSAAPFYAQALGDVLLQRADLLLISFVGGPTVAGLYSAAYNLVRVLLKLVQSFLQSLYPTLSRLALSAPDQFTRLAAWSWRIGLLCALIAAAALTFVAEPLLHWIYGAEYAGAVPVLQRLAWLAPLLLIEGYGALRLMIAQRPARALLITGSHLLLIFLLLPVLTLQSGAQGAAWAALLAGVVAAGMSLFLLWQLRRASVLTSTVRD